jgi:hypothetical protein
VFFSHRALIHGQLVADEESPRPRGPKRRLKVLPRQMESVARRSSLVVPTPPMR